MSSEQPQAVSAVVLSSRQLSRRYIVALSLTAILLIVSQGAVQFHTSGQEHDSRVVNIAGRQRMLSQKITKTSYYVAKAASLDAAFRYRKELEDALSLLQNSHAGLLRGDSEVGLPGGNSSEVTSHFEAIQPHYEAIVAAAKAILSSSASAAVLDRSVHQIAQNERDFLEGMDAIVFQYDSEAKAKVDFVRWLSAGLLSVTLLVLMLQARFVFAPAAHRIRRDTEELANQEARLRGILHSALDAIITIDPRGEVIDFNPAAEALFGWKREEILGRKMAEIIIPEKYRQSHNEGFARFMQAHQARVINRRIEITALRRDGSGFPVEVTVTAIRQNDQDIFTAYIRDITERRRTEEALKESEFRWKFAVEGAGDGVRDWNIKTDESTYSERCKEMLGYGELDIQLTNDEWVDRVHRDDRSYVAKSMQAYLAGEMPIYVTEYRLKCKDGSYKWILDRGMVVSRGENGKPLRMISTFADITDRKQAAVELEQHRHHLEELVFARTAELADARDTADAANRAKSIFLATMSHELRTPMNGVMGMIDLVLRRATDPQQIDWLNKSKGSAQHLLAVINDILDISQIESDRLVLEERNFSFAEVVGGTFQMLGPAAQAKGLKLYHPPPGFPDLLCGDPTRLRQILINYIGNAIKFSETGQITVRAHAVEENKLNVMLHIEVEDQGIGISPEQQSRLFKPFSQADSTMSRKFGGTGLGLIISKRIALLMSGDAGVTSAEGQGSTFWFNVKLKKKQERREAARLVQSKKEDAEGAIRHRHSGQRILVVDDEPINREVALIQLEAVNLVVDTAKNGAEAVILARKNSYAAIFMDMQMPKLNGVEATQEIRKLPEYRDTPIIAMTANAFAEDKARCIAAGMDDFLLKPFNPDDLFATLMRQLSQLQD